MPSPSSQGSAEIVSPLHAEDVSVGHRNIERCGVRVHVCTIGHAHPTGEVLTHERVEIERVPIGRTVEAVPPVRDNGHVLSAMAVAWAQDTFIVMRAYQNYGHGLTQDLTMCSAFNPEAAKPSVALHTEDLSVSRRENIGAAVRVSTVTRERERLVDETLTHERVEIERVPIGRLVDAVPPVREEGDTTIMPVVEETVVIERRLILKEEVHVRRVRTSEQHRETVMVQEQDAVITRTEGDSRRSEMTGDPSGQA